MGASDCNEHGRMNCGVCYQKYVPRGAYRDPLAIEQENAALKQRIETEIEPLREQLAQFKRAVCPVCRRCEGITAEEYWRRHGVCSKKCFDWLSEVREKASRVSIHLGEQANYSASLDALREENAQLRDVQDRVNAARKVLQEGFELDPNAREFDVEYLARAVVERYKHRGEVRDQMCKQYDEQRHRVEQAEKQRDELLTQVTQLQQILEVSDHQSAHQRAKRMREEIESLKSHLADAEQKSQARLQQLNRQGVAFGEQLAELREENAKFRELQRSSDKIREQAIADVCKVVDHYESENCEDLTLAERVKRLINKSLVAQYDSVVKERYEFQQQVEKLTEIIRGAPKLVVDGASVDRSVDEGEVRVFNNAADVAKNYTKQKDDGERAFLKRAAKAIEEEMFGPVCKTCSDTHKMQIEGRGDVPCTRCPVPCQKCGGGGPFCKSTPCDCSCHGHGIEKARVDLRSPKETVDHPPHYQKHPSGLEAIDVCEGLSFCLGNAVKYLWRAGKKGPALEDLQKARWYLERWIGQKYSPDRVEIINAAHETSRMMTRVREADPNSPLGRVLWSIIHDEEWEQLIAVMDQAIADEQAEPRHL